MLEYGPTEEDFDHKAEDFFQLPLTKERNYLHFDLKLVRDTSALPLIDEYEEAHRFYPLLGYTDTREKFVRNEQKQLVKKFKERPIKFSSHRDAEYLQVYGAQLASKYESALARLGLQSAVLAYRKGGGSNIHHAKALFDEVKLYDECVVFALDISKFFDRINHFLLREILEDILGSRLSGHDWNVFKNITKFAWVEINDIENKLGKDRVRNGRICSESDFKNHVRGKTKGMVRVNQDAFGIPQGTPVSGLYANIYLLQLDRVLKKVCNNIGGSYRRYSDDLAIVLPAHVFNGNSENFKNLIKLVGKCLDDQKLEFSEDKTEVSHFKNGKLCSVKPLQYLGFTFDGESTLIRSTTLDAYRGKMRKGIHAKLMAAKHGEINKNEVFKRELLSRYTHLGKRRNFLTYAYNASDIFNAPEIRQQVKSHMTWFNRTYELELQRVYG
ncbi:MAG: antiviral reverse transcriptase Drt2 [Pseudomonadota bacterium]